MIDTHNDALIRLSGVGKVYLTEQVETHALRGVDLEICEGEYVAIAGPSGGGKTTLLSVLGLLESPTDGEYFLAGESVTSLSAEDRADVRNRRMMSCSDALTKKYCCFRRSSRPSAVRSFGYRTFERFSDSFLSWTALT